MTASLAVASVASRLRAEGDDIDYTRLTSVSGQTAMTEQGYEDEPGRTGFYTQEDYAGIVDYAAQRHVVVPESDTPGHTQAALHAIPQLNTEGAAPEPDPETGVTPAHGTGEVGHSTLDTRNEVTYTFLEHVAPRGARDRRHDGGRPRRSPSPCSATTASPRPRRRRR